MIFTYFLSNSFTYLQLIRFSFLSYLILSSSHPLYSLGFTFSLFALIILKCLRAQCPDSPSLFAPLLPLLLVLTSIPSFISFCTIYCLYSFHPYNVTGFSMVICLRHTEWLIYPSVVGATAVGIVLLDQTCILALLCSKETTHSNPPLIYVHQLPQIKPKNFISFISSPFPAYED